MLIIISVLLVITVVGLVLLRRDARRISYQIVGLYEEISKIQERQKDVLVFLLDAVDEFALLHDDKSLVAGKDLSNRILAVRREIEGAMKGLKQPKGQS